MFPTETADPDLSAAASPASAPAITRASVLADVGSALLLKGVSQIFFADSFAVGILILLGVALASPRGALLLASGAFSGNVVAALLGADAHAVATGLYGFNAALASIAVGQVFLQPDARSALLAVLAGVLAPLFQIGLAQLLLPVGLPVLAAPFLSTLWTVLFVADRWQRWPPLEKPVEPA